MWEFQYPRVPCRQRLPKSRSQHLKAANTIPKATCQSHLSTPASQKPLASAFSLNFSTRHVYFYSFKHVFSSLSAFSLNSSEKRTYSSAFRLACSFASAFSLSFSEMRVSSSDINRASYSSSASILASS